MNETLEMKEAREEPGRKENAKRYLERAIRNADKISDEALIALFGCRGMHEIRAAHAALQKEPEGDISNAVESVGAADKKREDRKDYMKNLMRRTRAEKKAARESAEAGGE